MSRANNLRELAYEILKTNEKKYRSVFDANQDVTEYGLRYIDLKNILIENGYSDGAVTGVLYTLEKKMEHIHKVKTPKGVFFYYSEDTDNIEIGNLIDSNDFSDLLNKSEAVVDKIADILSNWKKGVYKDATESDLQNFRLILAKSRELVTTIEDYKIEKEFETLNEEQEKKYILPF